MGREIVPITVAAGQVQFSQYSSNQYGHFMRTVVASGVCICLWDKEKRIGVMTNFMYPEPSVKDAKTPMFGTVSTVKAIQMIMRKGGTKDSVVAHIIGGSKSKDIWDKTGFQNINIARKLLQKERIPIYSMDTGGQVGRKIVFNVENGSVATVKVMNVRESDWGKSGDWA